MGSIVNPGAAPALFAAFSDVTGTRALATTYRNTSSLPMLVRISGAIAAGSTVSRVNLFVKVSTPADSGSQYALMRTAANPHQPYGVNAMVPPGYYYAFTGLDAGAVAITVWSESV